MQNKKHYTTIVQRKATEMLKRQKSVNKRCILYITSLTHLIAFLKHSDKYNNNSQTYQVAVKSKKSNLAWPVQQVSKAYKSITYIHVQQQDCSNE